ncbi:IgGFc-binding protein [Lampris incognitus]|uniref:IgGFc-binding protein n=1 Tax=Lampris incognitus TaxID=2546036 RepID=UPI0024B4BE6E|nr:IgGFc-binding protein [Lampris incognitus]
MVHSEIVMAKWSRTVFTSTVSVTCAFMEGCSLPSVIHWLSIRLSACFTMLASMPGGALDSAVNGVLENLPFSQDNITVISKNGLLTIKALKSVQLSTDLHNQILVKIPNIYQQTTCGLCGNYNGNSSDDLQLPNGTLVSNPDVFGSSWRWPDMDLSCNDTCVDTCKPCISPLLNYTSELHCGLLTQPKGPFSLCHRALCPKQYYSFCMAHVCTTERQSQALCDALQAYEVACKEAGVHVGLWRNKTGCEYQCPQFSHYSQCANACSSLCPEVGQIVQCPNGCVEGCPCDAGHLYNGYACVPMGNCGCLQDGRRFEASESRLLQNCTVKCTCGPPLVCEKYSCPEQQNCSVSDGIMGCQKNAADSSDPCRGRCEQSEECVLSNGVPICETPQAVCWAWGDRHYHTFDGLDYDFGSTCTYLLAASRGAACGLMPFSVSQKTGCYGKGTSSRVVTVQAYGFLLKLDNKKGRVLVNGLVEYLPLSLLRGKIQVTHRSGRTLLKTDYGLQVVFDWGNTIAVTVNPQYKGRVYGLCGNFNGKPLDEHTVGTLGTHSPENVVDLAQEYRLFDGDDECCTNCHQTPDNLTLASDFVSDMTSSYKRLCAVLKDQEGPFAHCDGKVDADSFYQSCVTDFILNREPKAALDQAMKSYSMVCELINDGYHSDVTGDVRCPPNSHYKTCGSACPPSCDSNITICNKMCVQGCFCNPGFIKSPEGCVHPKRCGCTDSSNKYHSLNTTFWTPDNCGQLCVCGPAAKEVNCKPSLCPRGQVCKQLGHKSLCQPKEEHLNCSIVTGLHFITFDGHRFKFRDGCSYILVQTPNQTEMTPFNIIVSDARCQKRFFHSLNLKLSVYNVEVLVSGDDPEKILVDGLHKPLPYYHKVGHINAYRTPSSLAIHTDFGLQLVLYKMGTITIILPGTYGSSVSGLCGNANANPNDELLLSNGERAQNTLEFAHSWRTRESKTCRSNCTSWMKCCSAEEQRLFESSDFCGVLLNELGPFEECASVLSPINYFHSCVEDSCCYGGYYLAFCNAIASYAAACQAAQLPVRQWRSDTFCGMSCPKNSHYELCGPRCPVVCAGLSSPANCSGGCQEGCQCDNGYVRSDGQCVLVSDCGCMHNGQYYPAGYFSPGHGCQKCYCRSGEVSCKPISCGSQERCSVKDGLAQCRPVEYGVCQVLAGFGYITFDGLVLPHHGACTYVLSDSSSKAMPNYTLLLSFTKARNGTVHQISRLVFRWRSLQLSVDPETPWKIQLNEEELGLPFDMGEIKGYDDGSSLTIATVFGVRIQLSSSQYIRLSVPQDDDAMVSGLCGNFNGVTSDDFELKNNHLAKSTSELIQSWVSVAPGQHCYANCGSACDQCRTSTEACDILMLRNVMFGNCWNSGVEAHVYRDACIKAMCTGAEEMEAVCLAMEAYTAACKAKGITVGPWRQNTLCSLQCPDRSSPSECVDSSSNSCPALLTPGSSTAGCSEGCQCLNGNVFEGNECVPHSQCGCIVHEKYIKVDEQLYTENCSQRCWCHPLGGALCEKTICSPGQQCSLRNGSWGCHEQGGICELRSGLQATTLSGQQLNLKPRLSYNLVSFCDEASEHWFSLISYHGPCGHSFSRDVTVVQLLQLDSSVSIHGGKVKVNGHPVPLPYTLPSGGSLTLGANQDKSEITVVLSRDTGMESQLEIDVGDTIVTVKLSGWYKGKLCGICGDHKARSSEESAQFWVLADLPSCGFNG